MALSAIHLTNIGFAIVAYPFILHVVGDVAYARLAVTQSVTLVALTLVTYSFEVDGVAGIAALHPERDRDAIVHLFSDILLLRLAILAGCTLLLWAASLLIGGREIGLLFGWLLVPLASAFQAAWFYQGVERNVVHAVVVVASRLLGIGLLITGVRGPDDALRVPYLIGGAQLIGGGFLTLWAMGRHGMRLRGLSIGRARAMLWHGKQIVLGNLSTMLYRDANVLILNAVAAPQAVATYAIAEKGIKALQAGVRPLNQHALPKVMRALAGMRAPDRAAFRIVLNHTLPQVGVLVAGIAGVTILLGPLGNHLPTAAASLVASLQGEGIAGLLVIMVWAMFFGVANYMFGVAGLNALGRRTYLVTAILVTGVVSVVVTAVLAAAFGATGAALAFVLAEVVLFTVIGRAYYAGPSSHPPTACASR